MTRHSPVAGPVSRGQWHYVFVADSNGATERGRKVTEALLRKGRELGFEAVAEYPVQGGRLDVVWLLPCLAIACRQRLRR